MNLDRMLYSPHVFTVDRRAHSCHLAEHFCAIVFGPDHLGTLQPCGVSDAVKNYSIAAVRFETCVSSNLSVGVRFADSGKQLFKGFLVLALGVLILEC